MSFIFTSRPTFRWVVAFLLTVNATVHSEDTRNSVTLEPIKARTYQRITTDDGGLVEFHYQMQPGEVVLFAWADSNGGPLLPLEGLVFPKYTQERGLRMYVCITDPGYKHNKMKKWSVQFGTVDAETCLYGGRLPEPVQAETKLPGHSQSLPLLLPGNVEVWYFPFRMVEGRTEGLVAFIGKTPETIRDSARFLPESIHFSWNSSFTTARTLSTPLDREKWWPLPKREP